VPKRDFRGITKDRYSVEVVERRNDRGMRFGQAAGARIAIRHCNASARMYRAANEREGDCDEHSGSMGPAGGGSPWASEIERRGASGGGPGGSGGETGTGVGRTRESSTGVFGSGEPAAARCSFEDAGKATRR